MGQATGEIRTEIGEQTSRQLTEAIDLRHTARTKTQVELMLMRIIELEEAKRELLARTEAHPTTDPSREETLATRGSQEPELKRRTISRTRMA